MSTLISPGQHIVLPAPSGGVQVDKLYLVGVFAAVALQTRAEGERAVFALGGTRILPKAAAAFTAGELAYYDPVAHNVNKSAAGRFPIGGCIEAAAEADPRIRVRLFDQATAQVQ